VERPARRLLNHESNIDKGGGQKEEANRVGV
jgi:hypothetical protein